VEAKLFNSTAYGIVEGPNDKGVSMVVHRKPLTTLKEGDLNKIRDIVLANAIKDFTNESVLPFTAAVKAFSMEHEVYRCRLIEPMSIVPIKDKSNSVYKSYKRDGNYCYEIFELENGQWDGVVISSFEANQNKFKSFMADTKKSRRESFSGNRLVMRLCRDDIIADNNPERRLLRVVSISLGKVTLCPITEANVDARNRDSDDPFKLFSKSPASLKKTNARRVFIDAIGNVKDSGVSHESQNC
jgi:CRISPR-associated endonuclease Csn1